jgi:nucleoside-diphosphate-sugar epimerase
MTNTSKSITIIGCGWLGTPLARHFITQGWTVFGTTTSTDKIPALEEMGIRTSLYRLGEADEANAAHVADAAGDGNVAGSTLPETAVYVINIPPSRIENYAEKMVQLFARIPTTVRQVLFCSSTSVYTDNEGIVIETDVAPGEALPAGTADPTRHGTPRSVLLEAEGHAAGHPATTILRLAGLIGGDRNPARFLSGRQGVAQPEAPVNLTHLDDIIDVADALVRLGITGEVFNVCASAHPTRKAYYTDAAARAGLPPPGFDDADVRGGKLVDSTKIETYTGLSLTRIMV